MKTSDQLLERLGVRQAERRAYLGELRRVLPDYGIDTGLRLAHFLAQVLHESAMMRQTVENLNYGADALRTVFARYFDADTARRYAHDPERIANRVYGGRLGNGNEASGDGFRFRGRGLIHLTGRANYRAFSAWLGSDVEAEPELIAERYAVQSAVYYWAAHDLNASADNDDAVGITRAVNGGVNGLSARLSLLESAKALLGAAEIRPTMPTPTHVVTAAMLNLRSAPRVSTRTRIGTLAEGSGVECLDPNATRGWMRVRALVNGRPLDGYVAARYLEPLPSPRLVTPPSAGDPRDAAIPAVHLSSRRRESRRDHDGGRIYPLAEPWMPKRRAKSNGAKSKQLLAIVAFLDCGNRAHHRYRPRRGNDYGNVYACDFCFLAGVFLPHVWWREPALHRIAGGHRVKAAYGTTVAELDTNALHDWFADYGAAFGWRAVHDLDTLQASANNGDVCIIVARRSANAPGQISLVVPESPRCMARRYADGRIRAPVESRAGARNDTLHVGSRRWWTARKFEAFGMWRHA